MKTATASKRNGVSITDQLAEIPIDGFFTAVVDGEERLCHKEIGGGLVQYSKVGALGRRDTIDPSKVSKITNPNVTLETNMINAFVRRLANKY